MFCKTRINKSLAERFWQLLEHPLGTVPKGSLKLIDEYMHREAVEELMETGLC